MAFIEILVSICHFLSSMFSPDTRKKEIVPKPIDYETFANHVTRILIDEVKRDLGYPCEMTGGSMPRDIENITVGFAVYEKASVDRAREIEVEITERFLRIINSHKKIRPFLREYPFTSKGADIELNFYDRRKRDVQSGDCVSFVFRAHDKIFYISSEPRTYDLEEIASESYEEARKKVKNKSISL